MDFGDQSNETCIEDEEIKYFYFSCAIVAFHIQ